MIYLFDEGDERVILEERARNQHKANLMSKTCMQQGKRQEAASWAKSAKQIGIFIILLKGVFQHKN